MPSPLAEAHVEAQSRLRDVVANSVLTIWDALPNHDRENVDTFLNTALPLVEAGQRHSVALLDGFWADERSQVPTGVDPVDVVGSGARKGADPREVYQRPFTLLWHGLKTGKLWEQANKSARDRLDTVVRTDLLLSQMRAAAELVRLDPGVQGVERVLKGTCDLCVDAIAEAGGVITMPIHPGCECSVAPATPLPKASDIAYARSAQRMTWAQVAEHFGLPSRRQINRMRQSLLDNGYDADGLKVKAEVVEAPLKSEFRGSNAAVEQYLQERPVGVRVMDSEESQPTIPQTAIADIGYTARSHLRDYYRLPESVRQAIDKDSDQGGARLTISSGKLTDIPELERLRGIQPRGWPEGKVWDQVGGLQEGFSGKAYASGGESGSASTVIHELGHMVDQTLRDLEPHAMDQLASFHRELYDGLNVYLQQGGPGGKVGMQEFFAESSAQLFTKKAWQFDSLYSRQYREWLTSKWAEYANVETLSI